LGFVIYAQATLQVAKTALNRVNVRRLMLEIKRTVTNIAMRDAVFENNTPSVRNKFVADVSLQLALIQAQTGVEKFQVVCNESNNSQEDYDLNRLNGRVIVVPTRSFENIAIDFIVTANGVNFI
jgi:phage tail sheath protein FI